MKSSKVTVLGKSLHYVEQGQGKPVVLVHGNFASSAWWSKSMDLEGYRTIALDLPNFGRSDRLEQADIGVYAEYLAGFIDALKLEAPAVIGHSLGGAVTLAMLTARPAIAGSVILIDSAAPTGLKTPESHYPILEACRTNRELLGKSLAGAAPTLKDAAMLGTIVDEALLMAPLAFSGNARALERMDYAGKLGSYEGRVLVIWGRKDLIVNEAMARETAAAFKRASLEILDDVGHSVMVESPADYKRLVSSFLNAER